MSIDRIKRNFAWLKPYAPMRVSRNEWEHQYESGEWDYLRGDDERPHNQIIAQFCRGSILDLGCGNGALFEALEGRHALYTGMDLSEVAIGKLQPREDASFICGDITTATFPAAHFDTIVFNEVLYYLDDPLQAVSRAVTWLKPGGRLIVSMYEAPRSRRVWHVLNRVLRTETSVIVETPKTKHEIRLVAL